MPSIRTRKCEACDKRFDVLFHKGEQVIVDTGASYSDECPDCGSSDVFAIVYPGASIFTRTYPYFDRALKMQIESPAHRKKVCKALGLTPLEGGIDAVADQHSKNTAKREARLSKAAVERQKFEENPEFRRAKASGILDAIEKDLRSGRYS